MTQKVNLCSDCFYARKYTSDRTDSSKAYCAMGVASGTFGVLPNKTECHNHRVDGLPVVHVSAPYVKKEVPIEGRVMSEKDVTKPLRYWKLP